MEKPYQATPDIDVLPTYHPIPNIDSLVKSLCRPN